MNKVKQGPRSPKVLNSTVSPEEYKGKGGEGRTWFGQVRGRRRGSLTVFLERLGALCGGGRYGREFDDVDGGARELALLSDIRGDGLDVELARDLGDAVAAGGAAERIAEARHGGLGAQMCRVQVRLRDDEVVVRRAR